MSTKSVRNTMLAVVTRKSDETCVNVETKPAPDAEKNCPRNKLVIKVSHAGLNPVDHKLPELMPFTNGKVRGLDFSGTIIQVGSAVNETSSKEKKSEDSDGDERKNSSESRTFAVGDRVYGRIEGAQQEYVVVSPDAVSHLPADVSFEQGAAAPTAMLTAYQGLKMAKFQQGQSILVLGASGGVGGCVVQVAKCMHAGNIVAVCSSRNRDYVLGLGAASVVEYDTAPDADDESNSEKRMKPEKYVGATLRDQGLQFDCIFDCVSEQGYVDYERWCRPLLKDETTGTYVGLSGSVTDWMRKILFGSSRSRFALVLAQSIGTDLDAMAAWFADHRISFAIEDSGDLSNVEDVRRLYTQLKTKRTRGKLILNCATKQK